MAVGKAKGAAPAQFCTCGIAHLWRKHWQPLPIECDEAAIEGRIPKRRKQYTIIYVEPLGIAFAICPRDNVGCTQERRIGDPRQRATPLPVVHQAIAKDVLSDPLHNQTLDLGGPRQVSHAPFEFSQRRVRKAYRQSIDAIQRRIEFAQRIEGVASRAGARYGGGWQIQFRDDAGMVGCEKPRPMTTFTILDLPGKSGEHRLRNQEVFYGKREQTDAGVSA